MMNVDALYQNAAAAMSSKMPHVQGISDETKAVLKEKSQEFEEFFVYRMLESMQPKPAEDPIFGGSHAEQMFRHQLNQEYAKTISQTDSFGIADQVYDALIKLQEKANA